MSPLQRVLSAVQRRLLSERLAAGARQAAWGSALVALLATLMHLLVRPLTLQGLLAAASLPWPLAVMQAIVTRARPTECADWADRNLGGRSGYAASLESASTPRSASSTALAHLDAWVAQAAPRSLERLAAQPLAPRLDKPLATALVCMALAIGLLQLPTRPLAGNWSASDASPDATWGTSARTDAPRGATVDRQGAPAASAEPAAAVAERDSAGRSIAVADAPVVEPAAAVTRTMQRDGDDASASSTVPRNATGREAGDSRDTGADTSLTTPWTGRLAAQLRQITSGPQRSDLSADATHAADYAESRPATDGSHPVAEFAPAAATPPPAGAIARVGPVEQAYLRAYWAEPGAPP